MTKAFDLATLIPNEAAVIGSTLVVHAAAPALDTDWVPATGAAGGAFVPVAAGAAQLVLSGPATPFPWTTMNLSDLIVDCGNY